MSCTANICVINNECEKVINRCDFLLKYINPSDLSLNGAPRKLLKEIESEISKLTDNEDKAFNVYIQVNNTSFTKFDRTIHDQYIDTMNAISKFKYSVGSVVFYPDLCLDIIYCYDYCPSSNPKFLLTKIQVHYVHGGVIDDYYEWEENGLEVLTNSSDIGAYTLDINDRDIFMQMYDEYYLEDLVTDGANQYIIIEMPDYAKLYWTTYYTLRDINRNIYHISPKTMRNSFRLVDSKNDKHDEYGDDKYEDYNLTYFRNSSCYKNMIVEEE